MAYLRADDQDHAWAEAQFRGLAGPLLTCEAALSEAFFLLQGTRGGPPGLRALLDRGLVVPAFSLGSEWAAVARLMERYQDVPMSLADACLVRLAELQPGAQVFTLDRDFLVYKKNRRQLIPLLAPFGG